MNEKGPEEVQSEPLLNLLNLLNPLNLLNLLETRPQTKLPNPSPSRPLERTDVIDLGNRKVEDVDAQRGADADHGFAVGGAEAGASPAIPGDAGVGEDRHFDRQRTVEVIAAERRPQREAQFRVRDADLAANQSIERRA